MYAQSLFRHVRECHIGLGNRYNTGQGGVPLQTQIGARSGNGAQTAQNLSTVQSQQQLMPPQQQPMQHIQPRIHPNPPAHHIMPFGINHQYVHPMHASIPQLPALMQPHNPHAPHMQMGQHLPVEQQQQLQQQQPPSTSAQMQMCHPAHGYVQLPVYP